MRSKSAINKIADPNISFLLTNKTGGYVSLSKNPISRFQGVVFAEPNFKLFKAIENILPVNAGDVRKVTDLFYEARRERENLIETFFMPNGLNSIVYETSREAEIEILLDIRELYDNRKFGKVYEVGSEDDKIIIKFTKKTDEREDKTSNETEFEKYVVINPAGKFENGKFEKIGEWKEMRYSYDQIRNSEPSSMFVYSALKISAGKIVISYSSSREEAIKESEYVLRNIEELKEEQKKHCQDILHDTQMKNKEIETAYKCSVNALDSLICEIDGKQGIYAGLWWFSQFWTRDEAISSGALIRQGRYEEAKSILFRILDLIREDGTISSRYPSVDLGSSDAMGWVCKRFEELFDKGQLNEKETIFLRNKLKIAADLLIKSRTKESFALCNEKETWMDSLPRAGVRMEIQAARLVLYKLLKKAASGSESKIYEGLEKSTARKVREAFWNGKLLADGAEDKTVRPNIFIAYYLYPELLSNEEWSVCFQNSLKRLWLAWGGLSTVDKKSPEFTADCTGENPKSYHNGDSWYWINNLAGICLHKVDEKKFGVQIRKILEASANEMLYSGIIGYHAELSSASQQKSEGCLAQAWSSAMYLELVDEMKNSNL